MKIKDISPLSPLSFFFLDCTVPCVDAAPKKWLKKPFLLPDTSAYLNEESFAKVAFGWNEERLMFHFSIKKPFEEAFFPKVETGDSVELFIDTRDLKSSKVVTRFCHHFVFLPKEVEGITAKEVTSFRGEDTHPECDPKFLTSDVSFSKASYSMDIKIASDALFGFDRGSFGKIGFNYRINRPEYEGQHFAVSSRFFALEKHPASWGTVNFGEKQ